MNPDIPYQRYQELQRYVGWTADDARRVQQLGPLLEPHLATLIDDFYEEIERHPDARKVITGGSEQVQRLKGTLLAWLRDLFIGVYDSSYVTRRWRAGWRHVEIGLDQVYANVALARLRRGLMQLLDEHWSGDARDLLTCRTSLNMLLDLDLAIIDDAYQTEHRMRQQRAERLVTTRLTTDLRTLLDVLPVGIAIAEDPWAQRIRINPALARLLQIPYDPSPNQELPEVEVPVLALRRVMAGIEVNGSELELVRAGGDVVTFYVYASPLLDEVGSPRGAVGAFLDVTERKRSQERLLQSERLAAIGQMVTGLAHESGNALARSQSCLEMLTWEVEDRPEAVDLIHRIQKAQDHLKQLYGEVRSYAAPLKLEREPWSLSVVWRQTWEHLSVQRQNRQIHFLEETNQVDLNCAIDPFRLDQVFRNIFENSLAACPDPVVIVVRCRDVLLDGQPAVCVSVQDNGPGLSPEQRRRIFDPFFTTKTKGTGLGMAIAKRIVDAHGGEIAIGPGVGGGAELSLTLLRNVS